MIQKKEKEKRFFISQYHHSIRQPDIIIYPNTNYEIDKDNYNRVCIEYVNNNNNSKIEHRITRYNSSNDVLVISESSYIICENNKYLFGVNTPLNDICSLINYFIRYINGYEKSYQNESDLMKKYLVKE